MFLADPRSGALIKHALSKRDYVAGHYRPEHYWLLWMVLERDVDWARHPDSVEFLRLALERKLEKTSEGVVTLEDLDRIAANISNSGVWRKAFEERGYEVPAGTGALALAKLLSVGR